MVYECAIVFSFFRMFRGGFRVAVLLYPYIIYIPFYFNIPFFNIPFYFNRPFILIYCFILSLFLACLFFFRCFEEDCAL